MLNQNDIITFTLSKKAVSLVYHHVQEKERTVRAGGAYWTALSSEHKSKRERQITGYIGECALYVYWYGIREGLKKFDEYRTWYNLHPNKNDGGFDFLGMDVKTRRVIKEGDFQNWNKSPINQNLLNFEIIIRPRSTHLEDHRFMLIVVEYDNKILNGEEDVAVVHMIGWGYQKDANYFPKGQRQIRGEHYAMAGHALHNMDTLLNEELFNETTTSFYERMQSQHESDTTAIKRSAKSKKSARKSADSSLGAVKTIGENGGDENDKYLFTPSESTGEFVETTLHQPTICIDGYSEPEYRDTGIAVGD